MGGVESAGVPVVFAIRMELAEGVTDLEASGPRCSCTVACGKGFAEEEPLGGTLAVSFFAAVFSGAGAIGGEEEAGLGDREDPGATGGLGAGTAEPDPEGGCGEAGGEGMLDGGFGSEGGVKPDGGLGGGMPGGLGMDEAEGGTEGADGDWGAMDGGFGAPGTGAGLGGKLSITVSLGLATMG